MPALIAIAVAAATPWPDQATVLREINRLRADPRAYAEELRRIAAGYAGIIYREADGSEHVSHEGAVAVLEAAAALERQSPLRRWHPIRPCVRRRSTMSRHKARPGR